MSTTDKPHATEAITKLIRAGGLLDYGHDRSQLLLRVLRSLAKGQPVNHNVELVERDDRPRLDRDDLTKL